MLAGLIAADGEGTFTDSEISRIVRRTTAKGKTGERVGFQEAAREGHGRNSIYGEPIQKILMGTSSQHFSNMPWAPLIKNPINPSLFLVHRSDDRIRFSYLEKLRSRRRSASRRDFRRS